MPSTTKTPKGTDHIVDQYHDTIAYLESLTRLQQARSKYQRSPQAALQRFNYFLQLLNNPHKNPHIHYIHVAGTSGKGTTVAMTQAILSAAGHKTGMLISPHVTTVLERISIDGLFISAKEFSTIINSFRSAIDHLHTKTNYGVPSYFEIITAVAFVYFKKNNCSHAVIETGVGGLYDSTNVIPAPHTCVITRIDYDHMELLGKRIDQIARHKAGIIKKNAIVVISSNQRPAAKKVIVQKSASVDATLVTVQPAAGDQMPDAPGAYQLENASLAIAAAQSCGVESQSIMKAGLCNAFQPCRFETMQKKPRVIIDGAHNVSKLQALASALEKLTYQKLYLIIGLTKIRNPRKLFAPLIPRAHVIIATQYHNNRFKKPHSPVALMHALKTHTVRKQVYAYTHSHDALAHALAAAGPRDLIVITGSLYLAGEMRNYWQPIAHIIHQRHW